MSLKAINEFHTIVSHPCLPKARPNPFKDVNNISPFACSDLSEGGD